MDNLSNENFNKLWGELMEKDEKRSFYLVDTVSENYFVGRVTRTVEQLKDEMVALDVGETYWTSDTRGFERYK